MANNVADSSIGFESDFNEVSIFYKDSNIQDEKISKMKEEYFEKIQRFENLNYNMKCPECYYSKNVRLRNGSARQPLILLHI